MRVLRGVNLLLAGTLLLGGCDQLIPANQKMMKDAIRAGDQAVRSEEKTWAMLLRMEELAQRLETAAKAAEESAARADAAARDAAQATRESGENAAAVLAKANAAAQQAADAATQAETAAKRIEQQEGESYQRMLEFMRELGEKP